MINLSSSDFCLDDLLLFIRLYNFQYESLLYIGHFLFSQQQSFRKQMKTIFSEGFFFFRKMFE